MTATVLTAPPRRRRNHNLMPIPVPPSVPGPRPPALQHAAVEEIVASTAVRNAQELVRYNLDYYMVREVFVHRATRQLLSFIEGLEGDSWQDRWASFESLSMSVSWIQVVSPKGNSWRDYLCEALEQLVLLDVVRPGYPWVLGRRIPFWPDVCSARDRDGMAAVHAALDARGTKPDTRHDALRLLGLICGRKGKAPREVTASDILELYAILRNRYGGGRATGTLWSVLQQLGWLDHPAPVLPTEARRTGQKTPAEMIDRYNIASPQREVLIEYLTHRSPGMDHCSVLNLCHALCDKFWADIARHHPGLRDFTLTPEMAAAWKNRVATKEDGTPRLGIHGILFVVRAFYLDLAQWAVTDSYWAPWVGPSPVTCDEVQKHARARRQATVRTQQRTFERAPLLPALVAQAEKDKADAVRHLALAKAAGPGATVEIDGQTWEVVQRRPGHNYRIRRDGVTRTLENEEDVAFWSWAIVETLRHSGIRVEEMLELTHLAFQPYTIKPTGEVVPLVHIVPSKNDEERLLVASPELVHVLTAILKRIRPDDNQAVPLTQRWDPHERLLGDPLPNLFIHPWNNSLNVLSQVTVHKYLNRLAARADLRAGGKLITFTPHDFRRIFATEALASGLPPHIVQVLLGHKSMSTTMGYAAIYDQDVIRHHRTFVATRRQTRPSEEYREPTAEEWAEFEAHFVQRKVSLGTCGRAYGTNCHHEHACVRCALLRPDPAQIDRLRDIIINLHDRIAEAEQASWLGEVEGLKISAAAAEQKLAQMQRQLDQHQLHAKPFLGIPTTRRTSA